LFITVEGVNQDPFFKRIANFLKEGARVSFDDSRKQFYKGMGINILDAENILEINGRSILQIFPGKEGDFSIEAARQKRLQGSIPTNQPAVAFKNQIQLAVLPHRRQYGRANKLVAISA
jgi:hypothetical protein